MPRIKAAGRAAILMTARQPGFSRLELAVALGVFALLVGIFAQHFAYVQEYAEKTAMDLTVMNIRTGLRYRLAELMVHQQFDRMPALLEENPIRWLERAPGNYAGEFEDPAAAEIRPGSWYFDRRRHLLVYRLNNSAHFSGDEAIPEVRFRVSGVRQKRHTGTGETELVTDVQLVAVSAVPWF